MTQSSPNLQKARELAKNNPQLARKLDPDKKPHQKIKARQKRLKQAIAAVQKFYGEELPKSSILLVKPDSKDPLSIPLSRQKQLLEEKNYKEVQKMAISDLQNALNTNFQQNNQQTENPQNEYVENTEEITRISTTDSGSGKTCGNVENMLHDGYAKRLDNTDIPDLPISIGEYREEEKINTQQNNPQTKTPQTEEKQENLSHTTSTTIDTTTTTTASVVHGIVRTITDTPNIVIGEKEQNTTMGEKVSMGTGITSIERGEKVSPIPIGEKPKRKRGRPRKEEKLSLEKLSQEIPPSSSPIDNIENYSVIPLKVKADTSPVGVGKTSLTYLSIYSNTLTPKMLDQILQADESELPLTIAEIAALRLLKRTVQDDEKSTKMYWDLQKTLEKNKKPQQIRKTETTLLEQKLREAKNAILAEKPIDGKSDQV